MDDNIEQRLLHSLLNHEFFERAHSSLTVEMFPDRLGRVYAALSTLHDRLQRDIKPTELAAYIRTEDASLSEASKASLETIIDSITNDEAFAPDIAAEIIALYRKRHIATQIAAAALDLADGKAKDTHKIVQFLDSFDTSGKAFVPVDGDVIDIIRSTDVNTKWKYNLASLADLVPGTGPGIFTAIAARPEMGKTAFHVSISTGPDGFCAQGASVHIFGLEEPANRVLARAYCCAAQMSATDILANPDEARARTAFLKDRYKVFDGVGVSMESIEAHVRAHSPDILIVDQLDKVGVSGNFARDDLRIEHTWIRAREIAKRYNCAVFAISQINAEGEGRGSVTFAQAKDSRTGKGAEVDVFIGIGRNPADAVDYRHINVSKNKLSGMHGEVGALLEGSFSFYHV